MNSLLLMLMDGQFHSGQALGQRLGVSRSAVWKKIKSLETDYGLSIQRISGRGYRLSEPLSLLDSTLLTQTAHELGWNFALHERLDSTNTCCMQLIQQADYEKPQVVMAEWQTAGRGRRGRQWVSPVIAQNLLFSLGLRLQADTRCLTGLSLVVGLAVLATLRYFGLAQAGLKWPNDVYVNNRKIAGILLELTGNPTDICHLVIGIGINLNMMPHSQSAIEQPWTSLRYETGQRVNRTALAACLMQNLHHYLALQAQVGFQGLRHEWEQHHLWQGQRCILSTPNQEISGTALGIDDEGSLRLLVNGQEQSFCAGELSLRLDHDS